LHVYSSKLARRTPALEQVQRSHQQLIRKKGGGKREAEKMRMQNPELVESLAHAMRGREKMLKMMASKE
jgi:hypothetical protein